MTIENSNKIEPMQNLEAHTCEFCKEIFLLDMTNFTEEEKKLEKENVNLLCPNCSRVIENNEELLMSPEEKRSNNFENAISDDSMFDAEGNLIDEEEEEEMEEIEEEEEWEEVEEEEEEGEEEEFEGGSHAGMYEDYVNKDDDDDDDEDDESPF